MGMSYEGVLCQTYDTKEGATRTARLIRKHPRAYWGVSLSGVAAADPGEPILSERVVRRAEKEVLRNEGSTLHVGGEGLMVPVYADDAVDAVLEYLELEADLGADELGFAELYPIHDREHDLGGGLFVMGESGGMPAVVSSMSEGVAAAEFRPCRSQVWKYETLGDAVDVVRRRLGWRDEDLRVAVVPRKEKRVQFTAMRPDPGYVHRAWVGQIHAEYGDEIRVWPMDWNGLLDAVNVIEAVEASVTQMKHFLERVESSPDGRLVGRVFHVDSSRDYGSFRREESDVEHCYGIAMFPGGEVWPNGENRTWRDPFGMDGRTAGGRGIDMIGGV